jgi:hypothetical protein
MSHIKIQKSIINQKLKNRKQEILDIRKNENYNLFSRYLNKPIKRWFRGDLLLTTPEQVVEHLRNQGLWDDEIFSYSNEKELSIINRLLETLKLISDDEYLYMDSADACNLNIKPYYLADSEPQQCFEFNWGKSTIKN